MLTDSLFGFGDSFKIPKPCYKTEGWSRRSIRRVGNLLNEFSFKPTRSLGRITAYPLKCPPGLIAVRSAFAEFIMASTSQSSVT